MITSTDLSSSKEQSRKARTSHTASAFSKMTNRQAFPSSLPMSCTDLLSCCGVLLWHFESRTERELESIRSISIPSRWSQVEWRLTLATSAYHCGIDCIQDPIGKPLDRLSAQVTICIGFELASYRPAPKTPGKTSALDNCLFTTKWKMEYLAKIARKYGSR